MRVLWLVAILALPFARVLSQDTAPPKPDAAAEMKSSRESLSKWVET